MLLVQLGSCLFQHSDRDLVWSCGLIDIKVAQEFSDPRYPKLDLVHGGVEIWFLIWDGCSVLISEDSHTVKIAFAKPVVARLLAVFSGVTPPSEANAVFTNCSDVGPELLWGFVAVFLDSRLESPF